MPFQIVRNDITKMQVDAVVNAANNSLLGGGGVDGAIHHAAGKRLLLKCKTLGGCKTGDAKITSGYNLPAKYIIHTVGPIWRGGNNDERELLSSCYSKSLALAKKNGVQSIAFPLISSGVYGYPKQEAIDVATSAIKEFLRDNDMMVYLVIFDKKALTISEELYNDIKKFIDDRYVDEMELTYGRSRCIQQNEMLPLMAPMASDDCASASASSSHHSRRTAEDLSIDDIIKSTIDESFSEMLLRKIDESGMKDSECYKKANIDKTLFSKIRSNKGYKPSKTTVLAFAIALEMTISDTRELLLKAGYALSHSCIFDIIIEYFITNGNYNIFDINEALFSYDQSTLGSK